MSTTQNTLNFTKQSFDEFKKAYEKAVTEKQDTFSFQGKTLVTSYAKYVIEYVTSTQKFMPCQHKNITAEFMGAGFLRTCDDCGKII